VFGLWEMAFCAVSAICAYNGLQSYRFIGIGWLLHTGWEDGRINSCRAIEFLLN
jgi:hypothetical protein